MNKRKPDDAAETSKRACADVDPAIAFTHLVRELRQQIGLAIPTGRASVSACLPHVLAVRSALVQRLLVCEFRACEVCVRNGRVVLAIK